MIQVSDSKGEFDRFFIIRFSRIIIACVDSSSKEEDEIPLDNKKKGLHELLKGRNQGTTPANA